MKERTHIHAPKYTAVLLAVLYLLLGLILLLFPKITLSVFCTVSGCAVLALGIVKIIGYFLNDLYGLAFQFDFAFGIFTVVLGIVLLLHPAFLASALPFVMGVFILAGGLFSVQTSRDAKAFGLPYWWVILALSLLSVIAGLVLIFNPFRSAVALTAFIGVALLIGGAEKLGVALLTVRRQKRGTYRDKDGYIEVDDYTEMPDK